MKRILQFVRTKSSLRFTFRLELPLTAVLFAGLAAVAPGQTPTPPPDRPKDVVVLVNEDRVTGEIRSYSEGRLKVATDHEGDVLVKWNKIRSVASQTLFDVEMTSGVHYFGSLAPSDPPGELSIVGPTTLTVGFLEVFRLTPVRRTFWRRIDGSLDLGFNYTQASQLVQFNLDADATYRMRDWALRADLSVFLSRSEGVTDSDRATLSIFYTRFLPDRWLVGGGLGFDRNLELGLDLRSLVEVGAGRKLIQTNQTLLIALLGLSANHEDPVDGEGKDNAEALIAVRYTLFTYDFPKMNFDASLDVFPSLTESGRVRMEVAVSGRREIARDFYLSLSIFDSFDSKDPSTGESRNDWGPVLSVGWTF